MDRLFTIAILTTLSFLFSCGGNTVHPLDDVEYNPHFVDVKIDHPGFPVMPVNPDNLLTEEGIALGRKLYYDPLMHPNNEHACATCHQQQYSFSSDKTVLQHINLGFDQVFLWKGDKTGSIEDIMLFEVEEFFGTNIEKLSKNEMYPTLFKKAFGVNEIETEHVAFALAQFLKTLNSFNSKYDRYLFKKDKLTDVERRGELIFFSEIGDCFHCHSAPLFKDNLLHNNGLDAKYLNEEDKGHYLVSGLDEDKGKFKTPTLRNIALTAPYMHDGRFETLEEVITFYSYGVNNVANIDPLMKQAHKGGIELEPEDIKALVAFLHTLTDMSVVENPDFGPPT